MTKAYYFGCVEQPGHYLWTPGPRFASRFAEPEDTTPWGRTPDAILAPHPNPACRMVVEHYGCRCQQVEGIAQLHHKDGWTALGFWDRSVDSRSLCNSNFIFEGTHDFTAMIELATKHFPSIMSRFSFAITEYETHHAMDANGDIGTEAKSGAQ